MLRKFSHTQSKCSVATEISLLSKTIPREQLKPRVNGGKKLLDQCAGTIFVKADAWAYEWVSNCYFPEIQTKKVLYFTMKMDS